MTTDLQTPRDGEMLWSPSPERREHALITRFEAWLARERNLVFNGFEPLWQWSVSDPEGFWSAVLSFFDVPLQHPPQRMLAHDGMPGAEWFPGAKLNLVDQIFRHAGLEGPAILHESECAPDGALDWPELARQVASVAETLRALGVEPGDRVAGVLPNIPQAVVAFLAAASIGAVWSLCSPDLGPVAVVDRFRQIEPTLLFAADGYRHAGKPHDRRATLREIVDGLPTVRHLVWIPHLDASATFDPSLHAPSIVPWAQAVARDAVLAPLALPPDHPLWVLYSSGTTGIPKAIVHGHGGVLANGLVSFVLHNDVHPGDRVFWAVNTSWMVWNAHVLHLLGGATLVIQDGAVTGPQAEPDWGHLWTLAGRHGVNIFGVGAAIHQACMKAGVEPHRIADLSSLQTVCSTGSPLSPQAYRWLYAEVKNDLWLNVVAGGTDIAAGFIVGLPTLPVRAGEMQCRALGAAVEAWDDDGRPQLGEVGELVCTRPLPSMPLRLWGDVDGRRYTESYFDVFRDAQGRPVWRQGDWLRLVPRPEAVGGVIYGRSDATIKRHGVRMGTAEIYRVVESLDEVLDSLVADLEYLGRDSALLLFVHLRPGAHLDVNLEQRIREQLRRALSARHVPDEIVAVPAIPRTITGKKLELPVRRLLLGHDPERVASRDALAQPRSLDWFVDYARTRVLR